MDAEDEDSDGDDDAKDDDIASEPFYEVACPNCGETVYVSEDDLDAGEANCAHCGVTFEVALEGDGEEDAEDGPVQYEVTCPDCGTTAVFEEDELLDGAPKCPNCGKPLDFEVTKQKPKHTAALRCSGLFLFTVRLPSAARCCRCPKRCTGRSWWSDASRAPAEPWWCR